MNLIAVPFIIFALSLVAFLICLMIAIFGKKRIRILGIIGCIGCPISAISISVLYVVGCIFFAEAETQSPPDINSYYERIFGSPPPEEYRPIIAENGGIYDSGWIYLSYEVNTFSDTVYLDAGFTAVSSMRSNANMPSWWPSEYSRFKILKKDPFTDRHLSSACYVLFDEKSGELFYYYRYSD